jgi:hypothetical protein
MKTATKRRLVFGDDSRWCAACKALTASLRVWDIDGIRVKVVTCGLCDTHEPTPIR